MDGNLHKILIALQHKNISNIFSLMIEEGNCSLLLACVAYNKKDKLNFGFLHYLSNVSKDAAIDCGQFWLCLKIKD